MRIQFYMEDTRVHYALGLDTEYTLRVHYTLGLDTEYTLKVHYTLGLDTEYTLRVHYALGLYTELVVFDLAVDCRGGVEPGEEADDNGGGCGDGESGV